MRVHIDTKSLPVYKNRINKKNIIMKAIVSLVVTITFLFFWFVPTAPFGASTLMGGGLAEHPPGWFIVALFLTPFGITFLLQLFWDWLKKRRMNSYLEP